MILGVVYFNAEGELILQRVGSTTTKCMSDAAGIYDDMGPDLFEMVEIGESIGAGESAVAVRSIARSPAMSEGRDGVVIRVPAWVMLAHIAHTKEFKASLEEEAKERTGKVH